MFLSFIVGAVVWGAMSAVAFEAMTRWATTQVLPPGGGAMPPAPKPMVVRIYDWLASIQTDAWAFMAGTVVFLVWGMPRLLRWQFDRSAILQSVEHRARARRNRAPRPQKRTLLGCALLLVAAPIVGAVVLRSVAPLLIIGKYSSAAGAFLILSGFWGRRGTHLACIRCDYPMKTWRGAPPQCPECGCDWREPWRATLGIKGVRPRRVLAGVGVLLSTVVLEILVVWILIQSVL